MAFISKSVIIAIVLAMAVGTCADGQTFTPILPEQPRSFINTTYPQMIGRTIQVPAGGSLQAAIDMAEPGDTIMLAPGATYSGTFWLKRKTGTGWIVIRTASPDGVLPGPGTRVGPQNAPAMAKIVASDGLPAIYAGPGVHHYRLVGLEVTIDPAAAGTPNLIAFENTSPLAVTAALPTDLIVDRCYIHGNPGTQLTRRGVGMMGARIAVIDSYISEMHDHQDAQAIAGWAGPGPYKIVNNYLEATGENIFFFGYNSMPVEMVSSDIEVRGNYVRKPLKWKAGDAAFAGVQWPIKNLFEIKTARRVLIDGNIFENNWIGADQPGFAIVLSCNPDAGMNCRVEDITFTNNVVRNSVGGLAACGFNFNMGSLERLLVRNNLFESIGSVLFQPFNKANDVTIEHNTGFNGSHALFLLTAPNERFSYRNNIARHSQYGMFVSSYGSGTPGLTVMAPPADTLANRITNNVLINDKGLSALPVYPGLTWFPTAGAVGFVDAAAHNYRLSAASPYKGKATDGKDVGADMDALDVVMRNVISGSATGVVTTPSTPLPSISGIAVGLAAAGTATITWITSVPADGQVEFGTTSSYGSVSAVAASLATVHAITLSGLQPATTYQFRVRSRDAAGHLVISDNKSFTTPAAAQTPFTAIRINAGGPAYTDNSGRVWSADAGYVQGLSYATTAAIANTTTAPLYQNVRFNRGGTLQYGFTVPNGTYTVRLKFAEIYYRAPGERVFNIVLNGQTVQTNFDAAAAAGGSFKAVDRTFTVTVAGGQIAISLIPVIDNPAVNAIEITAGAAAAPIRVNAGGTAYTDTSGQVWAADTGYVAGLTYATTATIGNTTAAPLYQNVRFNRGGTLQYRFTIPNGTYAVRLKFAEIYYGMTGQRVFNIVLNGQTVQTRFDAIAAAGGPNKAVDRTFTVAITGGQLAIDLTPVIDNPAINAIEITAGTV